MSKLYGLIYQPELLPELLLALQKWQQDKPADCNCTAGFYFGALQVAKHWCVENINNGNIADIYL